MRGASAVLVAVVVASLAAAPAGSAQPSPAEAAAPAVVFEDATIDGLVRPLGDPGVVEMPVEIGCDALETPQTTTEAYAAPGARPDGVNVVLSPATQSWTTAPGDCPSPTQPSFTGTVQASASLSQDVPAYDPITVPLEMTVNKTPPEPAGENRSYGPYTADLTVTPGYFSLYNLRLDEKTLQTAPDETARFPITIDNFSNDATRFSLRTVEAPDTVEITFEPGEVTLGVDERGTAEILVELRDPGTFENEVASIEVEVTTASDTRPEHTGKASRQSVLVQFRGGPAGTPAPGAGAVLAVLGAAVLLAARR